MADRGTDASASDARHLVDEYLDALVRASRVLPRTEARDVVDEVHSHLDDVLGAGATEAAVRSALEEMGDPVAYIAAIRGIEQDPGGSTDDKDPQARVLGMPLDLRVPTAARVAARLWDPRDPRIIVPRIFGLGWTVNFGALAVRLHLIEPDAEDETFARVPAWVFTAACAVPVTLTLVFAALAVVLWRDLPGQLAVHWDAAGRADGTWPLASAFAMPFALAAGPTLWAVTSQMRHRSAANRGAVIAFASGFSALGLAVFAGGVAESRGVAGMPVVWVGLAAFVLLPLLEFVTFARVGRSAEQRADLKSYDRTE